MPRKPSAPEPAGPVLHANLVLIEVNDPHLLVELRADPRIGPLLLAAVSERAAVAAPGTEDQLLRQLLKSGHTPKVVRE